jgi:hypothetical protein
MIRSSYWILNIRCWYCPSHSIPFNCKKQQLVFYVRARLKVVFCRPSVHRQHRWPWQPPGRYVADTHPAVTSSGIGGSPEHAASGEVRRITQYSRHGHQIRSIRPVTLDCGLLFLKVLFLRRLATDTALRPWDTNLMFAEGQSVGPRL